MKRHIALVAHDNKKLALLALIEKYADLFRHHSLFATGSTGHLIQQKLNLPIHCLESGPLGGDQQIGAMIVDQKIDLLIFYWDPLEAQPHDPDVRALLRIAVVWNIPIACNEATADYLLTSSLFNSHYQSARPDFKAYRNRLK
ncbi:MAG: methylglyoxal synthase [Coxiella sp. RIFCSPHIGHO2_12_FULL_42_15]|nr:MAG: methylglyoxal synthase [Coxiella sp. RIFCSPHIGHO2_12_FULL_42_15]